MARSRAIDLSVWGPLADTRSRRADPEWSRKAILQAAAVLFSERGFAKTSLAAIAEHAGVGKGLVLHHFGSKENLLRNVIRTLIPTVQMPSDLAFAATNGSAEDLLRKTLHAVYTSFLTNPNAEKLLGILLAEGRSHPELLNFYYQEVIELGTRTLRAIFDMGYKRKEFRLRGNADVFTSLMSPAIVMLLRQIVFGAAEHVNVPRLLNTHLDLLLNGLKVDVGAQARIRKTQTK